MLRRLFCGLFLMFALCGLRAEVVLSVYEADMGQIEWYESSSMSVSLINQGEGIATIDRVVTSSSRLTAEPGENSIGAGNSIPLVVSMDGSLLGRFEKAVYIYVNGEDTPLRLLVRGNVVSELTYEYQGEYAYHIGEIDLSTDNIEFDDVSLGDRPRQILHVRNNSDESYTPSLMHLPEYLMAEAIPTQLQPGREGQIVVTLNTDAVEGYGLKQTSAYLSRFAGDKVGKDNEIAISAVVLPPFDTTSVVQTTLAPHATLNSTELILPNFKGRSKVKGTLAITNTGRSSLEIASLQVFHPAINVDIGKMKIAPGETQKIKITLLSDYMQLSKSRLRVLMTTNDPDNPKILLDIRQSADVEKATVGSSGAN